MNRLIVGLTLLAGIAAASTESGTAQTTTSETGLTNGMSIQQTVDQSQPRLYTTRTGVFISAPRAVSSSMSSLNIERFETRNRRLYAVMSLGDLVDISGVTPVVSGEGTQYSASSRIEYMDGRSSSAYNDSMMYLGNRTGIVDIDEGGIADHDGNMIDFGSPGVGDEGRNLIDIDEGGIADGDGNIIDFGAPGHGDDGQAWIDIDEGGIADNDGNIVDFGRRGVTTSSYGTWSSTLGQPVFELNGKTLPAYDRSMLVAVPVSVSGTSCESIELNLDVSGLSGNQVRRDGTHNAMTDRTAELKSDLVPVTILTSSPLMAGANATSMCEVADLVNGGASRHAIVEHLNMVIGAPSASELQAMR